MQRYTMWMRAVVQFFLLKFLYCESPAACKCPAVILTKIYVNFMFVFRTTPTTTDCNNKEIIEMSF